MRGPGIPVQRPSDHVAPPAITLSRRGYPSRARSRPVHPRTRRIWQTHAGTEDCSRGASHDSTAGDDIARDVEMPRVWADATGAASVGSPCRDVSREPVRYVFPTRSVHEWNCAVPGMPIAGYQRSPPLRLTVSRQWSDARTRDPCPDRAAAATRRRRGTRDPAAGRRLDAGRTGDRRRGGGGEGAERRAVCAGERRGS